MESQPPPWRIRNSQELVTWALGLAVSDTEGVAVLEFVRDRVCRDPDFGEVIDEHTRGEVAPGTTVEVIWTFDPSRRWVQIVTPFSEPDSS